MGAVTIDDNATAAITDVTVNGYGTLNIGTTGAGTALTKLANVSLANSGGTATIDGAAGITSLNLTVNNVNNTVDISTNSSAVKTLAVTATGANSTFGLTAANVETLTVAGDKVLDIDTGSTLTALKTVTVTGSAGLSIDASGANVTSVDMRASLAQVQRVLDQVIQAVEFLFAFTLAAGVMVLLAAMGAGRQAREREYAIMRALGAGRQLLGRVQRAELLGVGFLSGFMASAMALFVGWALARYVFEFVWTPLWWAVAAGGALGALLAWVAGTLSLAGVLRQPVVLTLRQAGE